MRPEQHLLEGGYDPQPTFTYHAPPIVSWVSPAAGPVDGGTSLTLFGSFFAEPLAVHIKGSSCAYVKHAVAAPQPAADGTAVATLAATATAATAAAATAAAAASALL